jgi:hypothetical protein
MSITELGGAALEVRIAPTEQRLDLQTYTTILSEVRRTLDEVDHIAIPQRTPRLNWAIRDLKMDREVRMILVPRAVPVRRALSSLAIPTDGLVNGVLSLSREAHIPAYFSDSTVRRIGQIGKFVTTGEVDHVSVASMHLPGEAAVVDQETTLNAGRAIDAVKKAFSSIAGTLEILEQRRGRQPRAFIRVPGLSHGVRIEANAGQTDSLRQAWGSRVLAEGLLKRNIVGQPISLELASLEVVAEAGSSLSPWELLGVDPEFTGGLSTADFIEQVRRG